MTQPEDLTKLTRWISQVGAVPPATLCARHHGLGLSQRRGGGAYGGLGLRGGAGRSAGKNPLTNRDVGEVYSYYRYIYIYIYTHMIIYTYIYNYNIYIYIYIYL